MQKRNNIKQKHPPPQAAQTAQAGSTEYFRVFRPAIQGQGPRCVQGNARR